MSTISSVSQRDAFGVGAKMSRDGGEYCSIPHDSSLYAVRDPGLAEPEFRLSDGSVVTVRRRPQKAFEAVGGVVTAQGTGEVTGEVVRLLLVLDGEMKRAEIQKVLKLRHSVQSGIVRSSSPSLLLRHPLRNSAIRFQPD